MTTCWFSAMPEVAPDEDDSCNCDDLDLWGFLLGDTDDGESAELHSGGEEDANMRVSIINKV
jgi:hypothetical protein